MKVFNSQFVLNIIIQVTLIVIFVTVFYFTYIKQKTEDVLIDNIDFVLDSALDTGFIKLGIPSTIKQKILDKIKDSQTPSDDILQADNIIKDSNINVLNKTITVIGVFIGVIFGIIVFCHVMSKKSHSNSFFSNFNFTELFTKNIVILIVIIATAFLYINFLGSKYINVNTELLERNILTNLAKFAKEEAT